MSLPLIFFNPELSNKETTYLLIFYYDANPFQLDVFRQAYGHEKMHKLSNNFRPPQPLNGRKIYRICQANAQISKLQLNSKSSEKVRIDRILSAKSITISFTPGPESTQLDAKHAGFLPWRSDPGQTRPPAEQQLSPTHGTQANVADAVDHHDGRDAVSRDGHDRDIDLYNVNGDEA